MSVTTDTERVSWDDAMRRMDWRQGEHVTLIGPTGRGKTELTLSLLGQRKWVIFCGTKKRDSTQDKLKAMGYHTVKRAEDINSEVHSKYILRPPFPNDLEATELKKAHSESFRRGLMHAFSQGSWTVAVDEARYICEFLGLRDEMMLLWLQGRSQGNSIIANTQRPRYVPLEAYDQASHLFLWPDPDHANVQRTAELAGFNYDAVISSMEHMMQTAKSDKSRKHDVIYVSLITGDMFITNTRWETAQ